MLSSATTISIPEPVRLIAFPVIRKLLPTGDTRFSSDNSYSLDDELDTDWAGVLKLLDFVKSTAFTADVMLARLHELARSLHLCLNNQVVNNLITFERLLSSINNDGGSGSNGNSGGGGGSNGNSGGNSYYYSQQRLSQEDAAKLQQFKEDIYEVISRDDDVFNDTEVSDTIYAVVAIKNNVYLGHIYAWKSPTSGLLLAMGIRKDPATMVKSEASKADFTSDRLSQYLIEGIRRLALQLSCSKMVVAFPRPVMYHILTKKHGFSVHFMTNKEFGNGIAPQRDCFHCIARSCDTAIINKNPDGHNLLHFNYVFISV